LILLKDITVCQSSWPNQGSGNSFWPVTAAIILYINGSTRILVGEMYLTLKNAPTM